MTYSKQKFPHLLLHFAIHYCLPHRCSSHDPLGTLCFLSLENFPHKQTFCCDLLLLDSALRHSQYWKFPFCTLGSRFHCETILLLQVDSHLLYILSSLYLVHEPQTIRRELCNTQSLLHWNLLKTSTDPLKRKSVTALFKETRIPKFKSQRRLRFSLPSIISVDLLGNRTFLQRVQKVMVCDFWLVDFNPFCVFLCFKVRCLWSQLWSTAAKNAIVKAAFESKALVHVIWCHQGEKGTHLPSWFLHCLALAMTFRVFTLSSILLKGVEE